MRSFELLQRPQRIRNPSQVALTDRQQVQNIPVLGDLAEQGERGSFALGELPLLDQPPQTGDLLLDSG
jgi:hypothetical protein